MSEKFIDRAFETIDLGTVEVELDSKSDGRVYVHHFRSIFPGEGNGNQALVSLNKIADELGVTLVLFPKAEPGEKHLSQEALEHWYRRHGYEKTEFFDHYIRTPGIEPAASPPTR